MEELKELESETKNTEIANGETNEMKTETLSVSKENENKKHQKQELIPEIKSTETVNGETKKMKTEKTVDADLRKIVKRGNKLLQDLNEENSQENTVEEENQEHQEVPNRGNFTFKSDVYRASRYTDDVISDMDNELFEKIFNDEMPNAAEYARKADENWNDLRKKVTSTDPNSENVYITSTQVHNFDYPEEEADPSTDLEGREKLYTTAIHAETLADGVTPVENDQFFYQEDFNYDQYSDETSDQLNTFCQEIQKAARQGHISLDDYEPDIVGFGPRDNYPYVVGNETGSVSIIENKKEEDTIDDKEPVDYQDLLEAAKLQFEQGILTETELLNFQELFSRNENQELFSGNENQELLSRNENQELFSHNENREVDGSSNVYEDRQGDRNLHGYEDQHNENYTGNEGNDTSLICHYDPKVQVYISKKCFKKIDRKHYEKFKKNRKLFTKHRNGWIIRTKKGWRWCRTKPAKPNQRSNHGGFTRTKNGWVWNKNKKNGGFIRTENGWLYDENGKMKTNKSSKCKMPMNQANSEQMGDQAGPSIPGEQLQAGPSDTRSTSTEYREIVEIGFPRMGFGEDVSIGDENLSASSNYLTNKAATTVPSEVPFYDPTAEPFSIPVASYLNYTADSSVENTQTIAASPTARPQMDGGKSVGKNNYKSCKNKKGKARRQTSEDTMAREAVANQSGSNNSPGMVMNSQEDTN